MRFSWIQCTSTARVSSVRSQHAYCPTRISICALNVATLRRHRGLRRASPGGSKVKTAEKGREADGSEFSSEILSPVWLTEVPD